VEGMTEGDRSATGQPAPVYTVGYARLTPAQLGVLVADVDLLVDCRERPRCRWQPQYNREWLTRVYASKYVWRGDILGGYGRTTVGGLDWIEAQARAGRRLLLMCAEVRPWACHRHTVIGLALVERGIEVRHWWQGRVWLATEIW
jgi:uncharacterized protein (DUF488 family)